jgi:hypothetical protein
MCETGTGQQVAQLHVSQMMDEDDIYPLFQDTTALQPTMCLGFPVEI